MVEWWESLSALGQVFACIAIPATIVMAIQIIMMLFGLGHSGDADAGGTDLHDFSGHDIGGHDIGGHDFSGADAHGIDLNGDGIPDVAGGHGDYHSDTAADSGFRLISFRSIIASLAIFGWTGLVMLNNGNGVTATLAVSFTVGIAVMIAVALIFMWLYKLQSDGTMNIRNALGVSGTVYLRIPAQRQGQGKVNVIIQGNYSELASVTDEVKPIEFGEEVIVIGVSGQNTLVVKRK